MTLSLMFEKCQYAFNQVRLMLVHKEQESYTSLLNWGFSSTCHA